MKRLRRWLSMLKPRSDCDSCKGWNPRTMHGNWWHEEGCPHGGPYTRAEGSDNE